MGEGERKVRNRKLREERKSEAKNGREKRRKGGRRNIVWERLGKEGV